jgi:hypothetical protein
MSNQFLWTNFYAYRLLSPKIIYDSDSNEFDLWMSFRGAV